MTNLTEREKEILKLIAKGYENSEISVSVHISIHTVKFYISNIMQKLDARNRTNAAALACKYRLIEL